MKISLDDVLVNKEVGFSLRPNPVINKIAGFRGQYFFLSNFFDARVIVDGLLFKNNEAAFQSFKTERPPLREFFTHLNPSEAKKLGRKVNLRPDWEKIKGDVMYTVVLAKFAQNIKLMHMLFATGEAELVEENNWGDRVWGTVNGKGKNLLGKILMRVRKELMDNEDEKYKMANDSVDELKVFGSDFK